MRRGWLTCTICRKSSTTHIDRAVDECDLSVFICSQTTVERSIKKCRAKMEAHKEAIMDLVRQLTIHQFEYDKNKARLDDLLDQQASRAAAAAASAPPPAASSSAAAAAVEFDTDDDYVIDPTNITTYDNAAAAAATTVTITVKHRMHAMQPEEDIYVCIFSAF
jgi:uncharacterized coiled-coil protein SlyX